MTGYDLYKKICALLGYAVSTNTVGDRRAERMTDIINQISADLKMPKISRLSSEICAHPEKREALIYGCAMMLAVTEQDASNAAFFAELYNAKRTAALCEGDCRKDVLPVPGYGGV